MPTIAYVLTRFPVLSQTFVLRELDELSRLGLRVRPYSLLGVAAREVAGPVMARWSARTVRVPAAARLALAGARALRRPGAAGRLLRAVRANRRRPRALAAALAVWPQAAWLARALREDGAAWVHVHFAGPAATAAWMAHGLGGLPYSVTPHAIDLYSARYVDGLLADKLREARFVVAISEYNRAHLARLLGAADGRRLPLVRCGLDRAYREGPPRPPRAVPGIVSVGRLVEKKGHAYLVEALARLRAAGARFRCVVAGDGPLERDLRRRVARHHLQDLVAFAGPVAPDRVPGLLDEADIFCLPAVVARDGDRDGLPVALLEAMARGLAVVSTAVTGIPEVVRHGETGLLVPERDAPALAAALARLIDDPGLRADLGRRGRDVVAGEFDLGREVGRLAGRLREEIEAAWPRGPAGPGSR